MTIQSIGNGMKSRVSVAKVNFFTIDHGANSRVKVMAGVAEGAKKWGGGLGHF